MTPPDSHRDLLERPLFAHLATVREDGAPVVNPMWFLWDAERGRVRMTHTRTRHNFGNIKAEPRVALAIQDPDDPYRYLQVRGVVDHVEDDPTGEFYNTLSMRYRGHPIEVEDRAVRVVLEVRPTGFKVR